MSIRESICKAALAIAEKSALNHEDSFTFMGAHFMLDWISSREAIVTCKDTYAGIRICDGIAELC
jgi:hypothetical protein